MHKECGDCYQMASSRLIPRLEVFPQAVMIIEPPSSRCCGESVSGRCAAYKTHYSNWRHNGCDSVSNYQLHDSLLNRLFKRRSTKTSKLRFTGLCAGNSPVTGEFPAQMVSKAKNVPMWWRHHQCTGGCHIPNPASCYPCQLQGLHHELCIVKITIQ